jgi:phosphatidylinositol alpha-1,6-mannosyltransferase
MPERRARPILLVTNNLPPVLGGSAIVYDNLARHAGGRVVVIAPTLNYLDGLPLIGWREHDRQAPYPVKRLRLLRTVMRDATSPRLHALRLRLQDAVVRARLLATLLRCILFERAGAVCIGELVASAWVLGVVRLFPWVSRAVYIHGEEITTRDAYDVRLARRRRALLRAHHVVAVSRFTAATLAELMGEAASARIRLIENGVDVARFRPVARQPGLLDLYGLHGQFVFVSVCRLLEKKGVDHAIAGFAAVVTQYPDTRYLVVGDGPYRATLEALARTHAVADKVVFTGAVGDDELIEHYALGDVFVMPNRRLPNGDTEGFGLVFLEANACGLPVIAGRDGGSIDAVRDGDNGLLVGGQSVDAITQAMLRLRTDAGLRERLRRNGLRTAAAADWRHKSAAFLAMFDSGEHAPK